MNTPYTSYLLYLVNLLEFVAAIVALIHYKKYIQSTERYFLHFLWLTFVVDTAGIIMGDVFNIPNTWVYYIYTGISFLFYFWWYHSILQKRLYKKTIVVFSILFTIIFFFNINNTGFHRYTFIAGAFFVLILTGFHLYQLSNKDYALSIKYKLSFWISIALVLFNIGMIPFILLSKYFNVWINNSAFIIILFFLNVVLYSCYIIGFTWTKKKYNHF